MNMITTMTMTSSFEIVQVLVASIVVLMLPLIVAKFN